MILHEHDDAACPDCANPLFYALKSETESWKVLYECESCTWRQMPKRIPRATIDSIDDAWESAERAGDRWSRT